MKNTAHKKLTPKDLTKIPKVEFHRHLDGSVRFETIKDLIKKNNIEVPVKTEAELYALTTITKPKKNLQEVLDGFWTVQKTLCNYEAIKRVTYENVEDGYRDGVKLLELRFAPTFIAHNREKPLADDEIIEGVLDGLTQGLERYPEMRAGLIHILPRSLDLQKNIQATERILRYKKSYHPNAHLLCGVDLADAEASTNPLDFAPIIKKCAEADMSVTIHTGEDTDSLAVQKTIQLFNPSRLGHGIKSWGDEAAIKMIKERNIHLEICPTSNWLTQAVETLEAHPLPHFYRAGVSFSINTDDPHLMGLNLVNEYKVCYEIFHFNEKDFYKINKQALQHSFLDEESIDYIEKKFFKQKI